MKRLAVASVLLLSILLQGAASVSAQTKVVLYPVADGYADSKYPLMTYGARASFLYVGNSYDRSQSIWGYERIYIRFDLSTLPKEHEIQKATLVLWQYYAPKSNQTYEAHRVLGNWSEATLNWNNQPACASEKTSEAIAPAQKDVAIQWDVTSDVNAWYAGEATNYGTMIRAAKEEKVPDASSGFWSREYPVGSHDEWKPRLIIVLYPRYGYVIGVRVAGLPGGIASTLAVDGNAFGTVFAGEEVKLILDQKTVHRIAVDKRVNGSEGVRYRCDVNEMQISSEGSYVFVYAAEYLVRFSTEPSSMFQTSPTGWYRTGSVLSVNRTGPEKVDPGPGIRLIFGGWYVNGKRLEAEPRTITAEQPITVEGRYKTEYYLNVTSSIGETVGSGWYEKDTVASFAVTRSSVPVEGGLGLLGLKWSFAQWIGSEDIVGESTAPQASILMSGPSMVEAVWREDWSTLLVGLAILTLVVAGAMGLLIIRHRRRLRNRLRDE